MIRFGKIILAETAGGQERRKRLGRPGNRPQALPSKEKERGLW